jgi:hypothetical protein
MAFRDPAAEKDTHDRCSIKAGWEVVAYVKLTAKNRTLGSCRIVDYLLLDAPEVIAGLSSDRA